MDREFNLGRAMVCEPIETVSGITVEFIAYRPTASSNKPVIVQAGDNILTYYTNGMFIDPAIRSPFDLRMKHTLRKIDWTKLPEDTVISTPEGDRHIAKCPENSTLVLTYPEGKSSFTCGLRELEEHRKAKCYLVEQQPWTVLLGGKCPIPDGLEYEVEFRGKGIAAQIDLKTSNVDWEHEGDFLDIIAYRLTGKVLDGYSL